MARHIQPSKLNGLGAPEVMPYTPATGQTWLIGAPISLTTGEAVEFAGGATVTGLLGFALQGCASAVPDFGDQVEVAIASDQVAFFAQVYDSGGGAVRDVSVSAPTVGSQYGLVKVSSEWYLDEDDTSDVVAEVTKILTELNGVLFKVIASAQVGV